MNSQSMDRESKGCLAVFFYCSVFCLIDVWKQITGYGVKYVNQNTYPIPQTAIVALTESFKLLIFITLLVRDGGLKNLKFSFLYIVPSLVYSVNNNVYYYAFHYTTPPIWNIIIQLRIVFTALTYRLVFHRYMSLTKMVGILVLIFAIILTNLPTEDNIDKPESGNLFFASVLAFCGSITSAIGAVTMEYLFKNDKQPFSAMQVQLYTYSSIASWILFGLESSSAGVDIKGETTTVYNMIVACIALSIASGIVVALIVKKLDNIVKLYGQAVANTLTSIGCAIYFPDQFQFSVHFFFCLLLMIAAVFIYESESIDMCKKISFRKKKTLPKPDCEIA